MSEHRGLAKPAQNADSNGAGGGVSGQGDGADSPASATFEVGDRVVTCGYSLGAWDGLAGVIVPGPLAASHYGFHVVKLDGDAGAEPWLRSGELIHEPIPFELTVEAEAALDPWSADSPTNNAWNDFKATWPAKPDDMVAHPPHYERTRGNVECIDIAETFDFWLGQAVQYLWRSDVKGTELQDLEKAAWFIQRKIDYLKGSQDG